MTRTKIKKRTIDKFLMFDLKNKLQNDLRENRITKEEELQCCVYYHLRNFLNSSKCGGWQVLTKRCYYVTEGKKGRRFPDLMLIKYKDRKKTYPPVKGLIELKWSPTSTKTRKDLEKLKFYLKHKPKHKPSLKTYFIGAVKSNQEEEDISKKNKEKRFKRIGIILICPYKQKKKLKKWKKTHDKQRFMSKN